MGVATIRVNEVVEGGFLISDTLALSFCIHHERDGLQLERPRFHRQPSRLGGSSTTVAHCKLEQLGNACGCIVF